MDDSPTYGNTDRESDTELDSLYDALKQHDDIRFATYSTAAKLTYIQRKIFLNHIDIWNMIEAFSENGLNTLEPTTLVNRARLETLLSSLYSNLNKRLPAGQNIDINKISSLLLTWLLFTYCSNDTGQLQVFAIKMALGVLSCGKLMDKLRYMFSLLTDCNGQIIPNSLDEAPSSLKMKVKIGFLEDPVDPVPDHFNDDGRVLYTKLKASFAVSSLIETEDVECG